MILFSPQYRRAMAWARHRRAECHLGGMSFVESSFVPLPPEVMLAPKCPGQRHHAWRMEAALHRCEDRLGRATVALLTLGFLAHAVEALTATIRNNDAASSAIIHASVSFRETW